MTERDWKLVTAALCILAFVVGIVVDFAWVGDLTSKE